MSKLILLLFLGFFAYLIIKSLRRSAARRGDDEAVSVAERMVACARCGVYLPEKEAFGEAGRFFCSEEHRRLGAT